MKPSCPDAIWPGQTHIHIGLSQVVELLRERSAHCLILVGREGDGSKEVTDVRFHAILAYIFSPQRVLNTDTDISFQSTHPHTRVSGLLWQGVRQRR